MKIEKKITFTVYGMEFDNLKTAQFFKRYVTAVRKSCESKGKPALSAQFILDELRTVMRLSSMDSDQEVVEIVMGLQMPKPARKKNPQAFQRRDFKTFPKKNVQALAGDLHTKEFWDEHHTKNQFLEPTLDEQEEAIYSNPDIYSDHPLDSPR